MYSASEIRKGLLKEFQKNGYACIEKKNFFYVKTKDCNYITCQKLRSYVHNIVIDIVIKDSMNYGSSVIDSYTVNLSRENFECDFKKKIVDDLVKSNYLDEKEKLAVDEILSEKNIKEIFEMKLHKAMQEENIYALPQTIIDDEVEYTTNIEYVSYDLFGLDYRVTYKVKTIRKDRMGSKFKELICKSVSLNDLESSIAQQIRHTKDKGFIEEKSIEILFDEFSDFIQNALKNEGDLKKIFDLVYNKAHLDGMKSLVRSFDSWAFSRY